MYRFEVIGRFPTADEADEFEISADIPVWLPAGTEVGEQFTDVIKAKIRLTRKLSNFVKHN